MTHAAWLSRVQPDEATLNKALQALALHQRYRFDPEGLQEGDTVVEGPYRVLAKELKDGDRVEETKPGGKGGKKRGGNRGG